MTTAPISPQLDAYYRLIDDLLQCPAGSEPEILAQHPDLLNPHLVQTLLQVAAMMAHQNQQEPSQFLVFIARQLAKQLQGSSDLLAEEDILKA